MKRVILIFLSACIPLLTGCWDYVEYNDLSEVYGISIDYNPDTQLITFAEQHVEGAESDSGSKSERSSSAKLSPSGLVHSATDYTIVDAINRIQQSNNEKLFFGYLQVIIIGENAANYIMKDVMEILSRTPDIKPNAYLLITAGKAIETLRTFDPEALEPSGINLPKLFDTIKYTGSSFKVNVNDFKQMLLRQGQDPFLPRVVTTVTKATKIDENNNEKIFVEQQEGHQKFSGVGVFKGAKFVGWLNGEESEGLAWIKNQKIQSFQSAGNEDSSDKKAVFLITSNNSKISPQLINDKIIMNISIEAKASVRKYFTHGNSQLLTPQILEMLEQDLSQKIKSKVIAVLEKCQKEFESDIFGFGYEFYRKYPGLWRDTYKQKWNKVFPKVEIEVNVKVKVTNTGTNIESLDIQN